MRAQKIVSHRLLWPCARETLTAPKPLVWPEEGEAGGDGARPEDTATLVGVLDDVAQHLLAHLGAHDVTRLALTSSIWRRHVRRYRRKRVRIECTPHAEPDKHGYWNADRVWVFGTPGLVEAPLRVAAGTLPWFKDKAASVRENTKCPGTYDWPNWSDNPDVPDEEAWLALARSFPEGTPPTAWFRAPSRHAHAAVLRAASVPVVRRRRLGRRQRRRVSGDARGAGCAHAPHQAADGEWCDVVAAYVRGVATGQRRHCGRSFRGRQPRMHRRLLPSSSEGGHAGKLSELVILNSCGHFPDAWLPFCGTTATPHLQSLQLNGEFTLPPTMNWVAAFDQLRAGSCVRVHERHVRTHPHRIHPQRQGTAAARGAVDIRRGRGHRRRGLAACVSKHRAVVDYRAIPVRARQL